MKKIFLLVALIIPLSMYMPVIRTMTPGEEQEEHVLQGGEKADEHDSDDELEPFSLADQTYQDDGRTMVIIDGLAMVSPTRNHLHEIDSTIFVKTRIIVDPIRIHGKIPRKKKRPNRKGWRVEDESENSDEENSDEGDSNEENSDEGDSNEENSENEEQPGAPPRQIEPKKESDNQPYCAPQPSAPENKYRYRNAVTYAGVFVAGASLGALYRHGKSLSKLLANFWNSLSKKADKIKIHLTRGRPVCKEEIQVTRTQRQDIQEKNIEKKVHDQLVNITSSVDSQDLTLISNQDTL